MSGDSESHLEPVEYVDIFVSSGISPAGPGHSFQPVFYRLSNPRSAIQIPPACDPPWATLGRGWRSIHSPFSGSPVSRFRVRLRHVQPGGEPSISYTAAWGCFPSPSLSMASPDLSSSLGLYSPLARPHGAAHFWQQSLNPRPRSGTEWFL